MLIRVAVLLSLYPSKLLLAFTMLLHSHVRHKVQMRLKVFLFRAFVYCSHFYFRLFNHKDERDEKYVEKLVLREADLFNK